MKKTEPTQLILTNAGLWLVAMLAHPLSRLLPTASGEPPKIFSLLIPIFILMCGLVSTLLLSSALKRIPEKLAD